MAHFVQRFRWWKAAMPLLPEGKDEPQLYVGGRYQMLQPLGLLRRPDLSSETSGRLLQHDTVLLLALEATPSLGQAGEVLLAYLANTKRPEWVHGWGPLEVEGARTLRRRRLRGSWEVGGRYRVRGSPVLRMGIELESDTIVEIPRQQEVLVLELGLVLRDGAPRLRAYVRTDHGHLGWLTVELPGDRPLLDPINLYSKAAIGGKSFPWHTRLRPAARQRNGARVSLTGVSEGADEAWEPGGKYRILERVTLYEDVSLGSRAVGTLKSGALIFIEEIRRVDAQPGCDGPLRLRVFAEGSGGRGWISSTSSSGVVVVDVRDHLEYEKLLRSCLSQMEQQPTMVFPSAPAAVAGEAAPVGAQRFSVQLRRSGDRALGIHVDYSDGLTLLVSAVTSGGLFEAWNSAHPERDVCVGDRILSVNGFSGDSITLLERLSQETVLDLTFHTERARSTGGAVLLGGAPQLQVPERRRPQPQALKLESEEEEEAQETAGAWTPEVPVEQATALPASWAAHGEPGDVAPSLQRAPEHDPGGPHLEGAAHWGPPVADAGPAAAAPGAPAGPPRPPAAPLPGTAAGGPAGAPEAVPATAPSAALPGGRQGGTAAGEPRELSAAGLGPRAPAVAEGPPPLAPAAYSSAVRLFVTEDGPDWEPFDTGAADGEEPEGACPCRADRAWLLSGFNALFGCGGDTGKRRLLVTRDVSSSNSIRGGPAGSRLRDGLTWQPRHRTS